jgi:hypothetical protein
MAKSSPSPIQTILWIAAVIILVAAVMWAASAARSSLLPKDTRRLTFRVESSGGYANITLKAGKVNIEDPQTFTTPWEKTVEVKQAESVFLTASNPTQTGQLTCKILIDHKVWKSASIPAPKDGVACAGIVP